MVADRRPVLQRYGVSDDDAFAVGLTCGGILDVFVERVDQQSFPELGEVADDIGPAGRWRWRPWSSTSTRAGSGAG